MKVNEEGKEEQGQNKTFVMLRTQFGNFKLDNSWHEQDRFQWKRSQIIFSVGCISKPSEALMKFPSVSF